MHSPESWEEKVWRAECAGVGCGYTTLSLSLMSVCVLCVYAGIDMCFSAYVSTRRHWLTEPAETRRDGKPVFHHLFFHSNFGQ